MKNKNTHQIDLKKVNKTFIWIAFVCVFIFTAIFGWINSLNGDAKANATKWWLISLGITVVVDAIVWVSVYFGLKKKNLTQNDKNIKKVIEQKQKEEEKECKQ